MENQFPCPNCGNPLTRPNLVQAFVFAEDLEETMDLFEGRLNSVSCTLCKEKISFLTMVIVLDPQEKAILVVLSSSGAESEEAELLSLAEEDGYSMTVCDDYDGLKQAAINWTDRYIVPIASKLISGDIENLPLEQQVGLVTPFFLRVLKASLDGYLPPVLQFSNCTPELARQIAQDLYNKILLEHLIHLRMLVVAQSRLATLPAIIEEHVPKACLTTPILEDLANRCGQLVDPGSDPRGFVSSYLDEYLCAAAHACAGVSNPRSSDFSAYLIACWYLSKNQNVVFDSRALLPKAIIHRLIRFEDLWDLLTSRPSNNPMSLKDWNNVFALLEDLGFQEEFHQLIKDGIYRIPDGNQLSLETKEKLKDDFLEKIFEEFPLNHSPEASEGVGQAVASVVATLLRSYLRDQAFLVLEEALQNVEAADDQIAVVSICANTMAVLCKNRLYHEASVLAKESLKFLTNDRLFGRPSLLIQAWNEFGNVARYLRHREEALEAYRLVEQINEDAPIDEREREKNRLTLKRNIGIVYRELGDYYNALEILKSVLEGAPNDSGILHNIAVLYIDLNHYEEAIRCLDKAIEIAFGEVRMMERAKYLLSRSQVKLAVGEVEAGFRDLQEAYRITPQDDISFRSVLAAQAMSFYPESLEGQRFVEECETLLKQLIADASFDDLLDGPFLHGSLCIRLLRDRQVEAAREIFAPYWEWIETQEANYDWKTAYIQGWLLYEQHRDEQCWPFFLEAEGKIDLAVPTGSNVQFAPFWLQDKSDFQDLLATVAIDLTERGLLPNEELLGVYEFMNGREISARILGEEAAKINSGSTIFDRCTSHPLALERNLKVFFFIETQHEACLACLDVRGRKVFMVDTPAIKLSDLGALKSKLKEAFKKANPVYLSFLDKKLAGWENLSRRLGSAIAPYLQAGSHVCFLPGRAFTGLPLHLLFMPDGRRLIEWNTVSFSPNYTVLLETSANETGEIKNGLTIVTVTKAADRPEFKQNALNASVNLVALLESYTPVNWLQEQQADLAALKKVLGESGEVIFLCHGTTAGQNKGYGICVSSGNLLPPTILSVRENPEHLAFILNWEDIAKSPSTFVSIACSSGITELGRGGVRFGLEQTLFSSGTSRIISPLWDVSQESSLYWIKAFYNARLVNSDCSLEEAHQQACMETRRLYPHIFFWGPFVVNGAL